MRLPSQTFLRHTATLVVGATFAQALPILSAPLLTRLYDPQQFGTFALFLALTSLGAVFSTARFELAILLPEDESDAHALVALAMGASTLFVASVTATALTLALLMSITWPVWIGLIPPMVLALSWYQAVTYWLNRRKNFRQIAVNRVLRASVMVLLSIGLGLLMQDAAGLVIAALTGQVIATLPMITKWYREARGADVTARRAWDQARRYRHFAIFSLPGDSINAGSAHLPTLAMTAYFSAATVGLFNLTQRVCGAPTALVGSAVGDIFRQEAAERMRSEGGFRDTWVRTFVFLCCSAIVPFAVLGLAAPELFAAVFGSDWRQAGEFARLMTPFYFLNFVASALGRSMQVAERQKEDLLWQIALFATVSAALYIGGQQQRESLTILLYSVAYSALYLVYLVMSFRYSAGRVTARQSETSDATFVKP